jgi:predicted nucleotide-binding protein (sugar kinase/HSP70/actin superfamily)
MPADEVEPLHPLLAMAADELIDAVLAAAAKRVNVTREPLEVALRAAWDEAAERMPIDWAFAILRLRETGNLEMLTYANPDGKDEP